MEQASAESTSVTTRAMKRGTAFGFALYEMQITTGGNSSASEKNVASQLGRLLHYEKQRKESEHFRSSAYVKDIGCLTSDPKRVDTRCPWGERGGIVGGYSDAIAEDEHEHPFGMRECTFQVTNTAT